MHSTSTLLALSATLSQALAAYQGFNYGSTFTTGAAKVQSDFEAEFSNAQQLAGTNGAFSSARLYTMIQAGTPNTPISAIPAALKTKTSLLLGMWASAGQEVFNNEIAALKSTISQYGNDLAPLVAGISVGSEDLYRISPTGLLNKENPGVGPDVLTNYIKLVRDAVAGTALSGVKIGHVDTWTAYANGSNKAVVDASDFLGVDAYPYFQDTMDNGIESSNSLFNSALDQVRANANGKELWITETGFPVSGPTRNKAVPGLDNAKTYWQQVGCPLFGSTNVWWFTQQDAAPQTPSPSFGLIGSTLTTTPLYDLSCQNVNTGTSSSSTPNGPSSSVAAPTNTAGPVLGGGSPGAGNGIPSSQLSIETQTNTGGATSPTQGSGSGSGSGSASGSGSGAGSGSNGNTTVPTGRPTPSQTNMADATKSGSWSAAFLAVMVAMMAL